MRLHRLRDVPGRSLRQRRHFQADGRSGWRNLELSDNVQDSVPPELVPPTAGPHSEDAVPSRNEWNLAPGLLSWVKQSPACAARIGAFNSIRGCAWSVSTPSLASSSKTTVSSAPTGSPGCRWPTATLTVSC